LFRPKMPKLGLVFEVRDFVIPEDVSDGFWPYIIEKQSECSTK